MFECGMKLATEDSSGGIFSRLHTAMTSAIIRQYLALLLASPRSLLKMENRFFL